MDALTIVVTVRCLSCGSSYTKPAGRGTVKTNPGCPKCGYLGWSLAEGELNALREQRRSAEGPPPRRAWRSG